MYNHCAGLQEPKPVCCAASKRGTLPPHDGTELLYVSDGGGSTEMRQLVRLS